MKEAKYKTQITEVVSNFVNSDNSMSVDYKRKLIPLIVNRLDLHKMSKQLDDGIATGYTLEYQLDIFRKKLIGSKES